MSGPVRSLTTVRHSLTAHNTAGIITGRLDEPLSEEGRAAARSLTQTKGLLPAGIVLSSPARRAFETAQLLTLLPHGDIVLDRRCHERHYGVLQGLDRAQAAEHDSQITYVSSGGVRHSVDPPGGETLDQLRARAWGFLKTLRALPAPSVLLFSHATFLQQLHGLLLHRTSQETLAHPIRSLQIDHFALHADGIAEHHLVHEGLPQGLVW
jgi:probable phosphoglycerate mutase